MEEPDLSQLIMEAEEDTQLPDFSSQREENEYDFPPSLLAEVREREERDRRLAAVPGLAAAMGLEPGDHEEPLREHLAPRIAECVSGAAHARMWTDQQALAYGGAYKKDDDVNNKWKDPLTYYTDGNRTALRAPPAFDMRDYTVMDLEWMNQVAANKDRTLTERSNLICLYLNNFWCYMRGKKATVISKRPDYEHPGHIMALVMDIASFRTHTNQEVAFRMPDVFDANYVNHVMEVFKGSVKKADVPRPFSNRPPGRPRTATDDRDEAAEEQRREEARRLEFASAPKYTRINLAKLWETHRLRRDANGITYDPHPVDNPLHPPVDILNLWTGLNYTREKCMGLYDSDIEATRRADFILKHILELLCDNDRECFEAEIYSDAKMLQQPWVKYDSLHIMYGMEGVGKSAYMNCLAQIVGQWQYHATTNLNDITGDFTDVLDGVYLVYLNEAYNPNDPKSDAAMKALVTENKFRLRKLYAPTERKKKFFKIKADTNLKNVVQADPRCRRFNMWQSALRPRDAQYYRDLAEAVEADDWLGTRAFADYLYNYDLVAGDEKFDNGRKIVKTKLLMEQQMACLDPLAGLILESLNYGKTLDPASVSDRKDPLITKARNEWCDLLKLTLEEHREFVEAEKLHPNPGPEAILQRQEREQAMVKIESLLQTGSEWLTLIQMKDFMMLYDRRYKAYGRQSSTERKLDENGVVSRLKILLGSKNVTRKSFSKVHLLASHNDSADVQYNEEARTSFRQRVGKRDYLVLPPLHIARREFIDSMGWASDPFEVQVVDDKYLAAREGKRKKLHRPDGVRGTIAPRNFEVWQADFIRYLQDEDPEFDMSQDVGQHPPAPLPPPRPAPARPHKRARIEDLTEPSQESQDQENDLQTMDLMSQS